LGCLGTGALTGFVKVEFYSPCLAKLTARREAPRESSFEHACTLLTLINLTLGVDTTPRATSQLPWIKK
jgi:hypothetical protein